MPEGGVGESILSAFASGKKLVVTVLAAMGEQEAVAVREAEGN
ncbi:hypothetical protein [Streptomyces agglomeratus]|nr:hypothetical protein [Streptomyces agglomeratus]